MKAFFCWVPKLGGNPETGNGGIHQAETAGEARYSSYQNAQDAYPEISIIDVRVRRAPVFDGVQHKNGIMPRFIEA